MDLELEYKKNIEATVRGHSLPQVFSLISNLKRCFLYDLWSLRIYWSVSTFTTSIFVTYTAERMALAVYIC